MKLRVTVERWPRVAPFRITGHVWDHIEVLFVALECGDYAGQAEAAGVYYRNDLPSAMADQIERLRPEIERGITRDKLQSLLPAGGARNALDCALWELEARTQGRSVWQLLGLDEPRALLTAFTCGANTPEAMAADARGYPGAKAIKLKLTGDALDRERVSAVREAMREAWLGVDANQGFTRVHLENLLPTLVDAGVSLIEQPFAIGAEELLDGFDSPIPIAADESVQDSADLPSLIGRFDVVNIKLDKCGGLTHAVSMAKRAAEMGLDVMVGNMGGTSLAMAPAFLLGQLCSVVDLDGPASLRVDRSYRVNYAGGLISCPEELWGGHRTDALKTVKQHVGSRSKFPFRSPR